MIVFYDEDADGFGDPNRDLTINIPDPTPFGYVNHDDCDDIAASINPGATETPGDGTDSNCDGNDDT